MNEKVNKFLLAGDKFMPEMHDNQDLFTALVDRLQKIKKESRNLKKWEIEAIFTKMN